MKKHGALAGVTKPEDVAEYKKWLQHKDMFMTDWDRKAVDAQWKFLEVAKKTGVISKVPAEERVRAVRGKLSARKAAGEKDQA